MIPHHADATSRGRALLAEMPSEARLLSVKARLAAVHGNSLVS